MAINPVNEEITYITFRELYYESLKAFGLLTARLLYKVIRFACKQVALSKATR
jgi:hypothetical protein